MGGLGPRSGSQRCVRGFYRCIHVVFSAHGYQTPNGGGCRIGDLDGVLSLTLAPGAADEVRGDVTVGDLNGVAGELLWFAWSSEHRRFQ